MKRLNLEAFKAKNIKPETKQTTDKLLGQVLGDCHDSSVVPDLTVKSGDTEDN